MKSIQPAIAERLDTSTTDNRSNQWAYDCVQLCYTIHYRTLLITFLLILQTIVIAQMSDEAEGSRAKQLALICRMLIFSEFMQMGRQRHTAEDNDFINY